MMMLPAVASRFWSRDITSMIFMSIGIGILSGYAGLLLSFHTAVPAGPAIILVAGAIYVGSVVFGRFGGIARQFFPGRHLEA
jgi:zinc/manganese transport system permease protein